MQMAQYLPKSVFGVWHHIPKFVSAGGTALNKFSGVLLSSSGSGGNVNDDSAPMQRNYQRIAREYGLPVDLQKELGALTFKNMFSENTVGANSEALLCLRKGPPGMWGECEDYADFVVKLAELENGRRAGREGGKKLKVAAYFGESDAMIGKKGQSYMESCWGGDGFQEVLEFTTTTVGETDHDNVVSSVDALEQIFVMAGGLIPVGP